jgi:uncharacterized repeat protein (TIGR01451 family)
MKTTSYSPGSKWRTALRNTVAILALAGFGMGSALAATPLAGTTIGNQAAATYTDASLTPRTATSNTVTTIVQQVAGFTLTASQTKSASAGSSVNFPHTILNTGNGTDSFALTNGTATGTPALTAQTYYIDANCDGIADNATPITSISGVLPGASACFVAVTSVPVTNTTTGTIVVNAASGYTPAVTATNTDTVNVTTQAVINVTKSISQPSGLPGTTPVTYTLTFTNTGNAAATNVILADFLPANATYVAGTAKLNGAGIADSATAADGTAGHVFDFGVTLAGRATAIISSVAAGQSGTLAFSVTMGQATAPVTPPSVISNQARYCYNDGVAVQPVTTCTTANVETSATAGSGAPTNTANFTVLQLGAVAANADAVSILAGGVTPTFDTVTVASATQGATVTFTDYIHNNGNGMDTFNITLASGNFPAGTTFLLFKSDGVTPLTDTNSIPDGIVDTGPMAAGAAYAVVVKATLSSSATGGGAYTAVLTATSTFDPTKSDPVNDVLTTIAPNTVDLTTGFPVGTIATPTATAGAQGFGAGPSLASVTGGNPVNPGGTVTYPLFINNTSPVADTYAITTTAALPAGWSVAYYADASAGACTTLGATVTNTGVINGVTGGVSANKVVCAVVTVAATGTTSYPGTNNITFQALSPTTGAIDTKLETVKVNTVRSITLTPPNSGQVFPSGSVTYAHILTNNGNVTEAAATSTITMTDPLSGVTTGWNNVIYWDANNNGILDASDPIVSGTTLNALAGATTDGVAVAIGGGLLPGKSIRLFVKVLAPGSAAAGDIDTSSLTATTTGLVNTIAAPGVVVAADTTTVIVGQVLMTKTQALDTGCTGLAGPYTYSTASITTGAVPGSCVLYQITATNVGTADVTTVIVSDATPANTTYKVGGVSTAATTVGSITAPGDGTAGTISATVGTLAPAASAVITFGVKINP